MSRINSTFTILGNDVKNIAAIAAHYGSVVSVTHAKGAEISRYNVRYISDGGLFDDEVEVYASVRVLKTTTILARAA